MIAQPSGNLYITGKWCRFGKRYQAKGLSVAHSPCYVYGVYSTVGRSVVSIYDLGGILTSGCIHIPAIDLTTVLYAILVWQLHNQMKHCVELLYNNIRTSEVRKWLCIRYTHLQANASSVVRMYIHINITQRWCQCSYTGHLSVVTVGVSVGVSVWLPWACQCGYSGCVSVVTVGVSVWLQWACQCGYSGCVSVGTVGVSVWLQWACQRCCRAISSGFQL